MMWDPGFGVGPWGGWLGMLLMGLFTLFVLAGFVVLVVWAIRAFGMGGQQAGGMTPPAEGTSSDEAAEIARKRFARGEISKEELDDILRVLRST